MRLAHQPFDPRKPLRPQEASFLMQGVTSVRALHCACGLLVSLACLTNLPLVCGEAPQWTRLFPPGGQRGQSVAVEAKGKFPNPSPQVWVDRADLKFQPGTEPGKWTVVIDQTAAPGMALVRAYDQEGATELLPFLIGTVAEQNEQEPNDERQAAQALAEMPRLINGVLEKRGDVDHYKVQLKAGETLVASIDANRFLRSPVDSCLQIVSPQGYVLQQNLDYHDLDPLVTYTASEDEEVLVRVFGFPATPDSTIQVAGGESYVYRLTVTTGPYLEATLPLAAYAGDTNALKPFGWNIAQDAPELSFSPSAIDALDGIVPAGKSQLFGMEGYAGQVLLGVSSQKPQVDRRADRQEEMLLSIPASVSGRLPESGMQAYDFELKKGSAIEAVLTSRSLGYALDSVLTILDSTGKQLVRVDDVSKAIDPRLSWTSPADGRYQIVVSDLNMTRSDQNFYHLTVAPQSPVFRVTAKTNIARGKINEALEVPLSIERLGGFADPIEFEVLGLPPSLACTLPKSEPKGDSAKQVKLIFKATEPFNGPLQIKAKGSSQSHWVGDETFETTHFWVFLGR